MVVNNLNGGAENGRDVPMAQLRYEPLSAGEVLGIHDQLFRAISGQVQTVVDRLKDSGMKTTVRNAIAALAGDLPKRVKKMGLIQTEADMVKLATTVKTLTNQAREKMRSGSARELLDALRSYPDALTGAVRAKLKPLVNGQVMESVAAQSYEAPVPVTATSTDVEAAASQEAIQASPDVRSEDGTVDSDGLPGGDVGEPDSPEALPAEERLLPADFPDILDSLKRLTNVAFAEFGAALREALPDMQETVSEEFMMHIVRLSKLTLQGIDQCLIAEECAISAFRDHLRMSGVTAALREKLQKLDPLLQQQFQTFVLSKLEETVGQIDSMASIVDLVERADRSEALASPADLAVVQSLLLPQKMAGAGDALPLTQREGEYLTESANHFWEKDLDNAAKIDALRLRLCRQIHGGVAYRLKNDAIISHIDAMIKIRRKKNIERSQAPEERSLRQSVGKHPQNVPSEPKNPLVAEKSSIPDELWRDAYREIPMHKTALLEHLKKGEDSPGVQHRNTDRYVDYLADLLRRQIFRPSMDVDVQRLKFAIWSHIEQWVLLRSGKVIVENRQRSDEAILDELMGLVRKEAYGQDEPWKGGELRFVLRQMLRDARTNGRPVKFEEHASNRLKNFLQQQSRPPKQMLKAEAAATGASGSEISLPSADRMQSVVDQDAHPPVAAPETMDVVVPLSACPGLNGIPEAELADCVAAQMMRHVVRAIGTSLDRDTWRARGAERPLSVSFYYEVGALLAALQHRLLNVMRSSTGLLPGSLSITDLRDRVARKMEEFSQRPMAAKAGYDVRELFDSSVLPAVLTCVDDLCRDADSFAAALAGVSKDAADSISSVDCMMLWCPEDFDNDGDPVLLPGERQWIVSMLDGVRRGGVKASQPASHLNARFRAGVPVWTEQSLAIVIDRLAAEKPAESQQNEMPVRSLHPAVANVDRLGELDEIYDCISKGRQSDQPLRSVEQTVIMQKLERQFYHRELTAGERARVQMLVCLSAEYVYLEKTLHLWRRKERKAESIVSVLHQIYGDSPKPGGGNTLNKLLDECLSGHFPTFGDYIALRLGGGNWTPPLSVPPSPAHPFPAIPSKPAEVPIPTAVAPSVSSPEQTVPDLPAVDPMPASVPVPQSSPEPSIIAASIPLEQHSFTFSAAPSDAPVSAFSISPVPAAVPVPPALAPAPPSVPAPEGVELRSAERRLHANTLAFVRTQLTMLQKAQVTLRELEERIGRVDAAYERDDMDRTDCMHQFELLSDRAITLKDRFQEKHIDDETIAEAGECLSTLGLILPQRGQYLSDLALAKQEVDSVAAEVLQQRRSLADFKRSTSVLLQSLLAGVAVQDLHIGVEVDAVEPGALLTRLDNLEEKYLELQGHLQGMLDRLNGSDDFDRSLSVLRAGWMRATGKSDPVGEKSGSRIDADAPVATVAVVIEGKEQKIVLNAVQLQALVTLVTVCGEQKLSTTFGRGPTAIYEAVLEAYPDQLAPGIDQFTDQLDALAQKIDVSVYDQEVNLARVRPSQPIIRCLHSRSARAHMYIPTRLALTMLEQVKRAWHVNESLVQDVFVKPAERLTQAVKRAAKEKESAAPKKPRKA